MATPVLRKEQPGSKPSGRNRIFISYSHWDYKDYAQTFYEFLSEGLKSAPSLGYIPEDIFFDGEQLKPGDNWNERIQEALHQCELLIFLASNRSLGSKYCVPCEVSTAVARGIKLISVVLRECSWATRPIPGAKNGETLGSFESLPKVEQTAHPFEEIVSKKLKPPDTVWVEIASKIIDVLADLRAQKQPDQVVPLRPISARLPRLVAYRCDQMDTVRDFEESLAEWKSLPLIVLLKGTYYDKLESFWERLRRWKETHLPESRLHLPTDEKPLKLVLPQPRQAKGGRENARELEAELWHSFSKSLQKGQVGGSILNRQDLARFLSTRKDPLVFLAPLGIADRKSARDQGIVFRTLVNALSSGAEMAELEQHLEKLVIVVLVEGEHWDDDFRILHLWDIQPALRPNGRFLNWVPRWMRREISNVPTAPQVHWVEPKSLGDFGWADVDTWIHVCDRDESVTPNRDSLKLKLFPDSQPNRRLRFAEFEQALKNLNIISS